MARYTPDSKERVRDAVDFIDLVGQYTELKRAGTNRYTGLCPFHDERTPSFGIEPAQKLFKCFGCGEGGDVFRFVELKEGLEFRAALEFLADRYSVELELAEEDPAAAQRREKRERLLELLDRTATFYARYLWDAKEAARAREYLAGRGLDEGVLREFRVGFSPKPWDTVLLASRRAGFSNRELYDSGLAQRSQSTNSLYDRFRGRIMFPLCDRRGRVLGFGARRMNEEDKGPKYLNSADGELFHKGQNLYAADIARVHATKSGSVVLAEGYTDVIALHQAGLRNTVGLMGTALTEEQVTELARLAPVVQLALDADSAGQDAMLRAAKVAAGRRLELRVVPLPAGSDPADLVAAQGASAVRDLVAASQPFVRFRVQRELDRADLASDEGKDAAIEAMRPVFAGLPPGVVRDELIKHVADRADLKVHFVTAALAHGPMLTVAPARATSNATATITTPAPTLLRGSVKGGHARTERAFLAQCAARPDDARDLLAVADVDGLFTVDLHRRAAAQLRDHPDDPTAGLGDDDDLASLIAGIVVRTADQRPSQAALEAELAKLRLADVERRMAEARTAGRGDVAALATRRTELQAAVHAAIDRAMEDLDEA